MARQVLPIVGAVVGAYFGGPQGAQIGYAIGAAVGNAVDPLVVKAPSIGDSRTQTSAEVFRPIYFGTACGAGNIIMAGPDVKRIVENDPGKGGGPVTEEERISKTFAIAIGDGWNGPIVGISRIWENEKLVYDTRPGSTMVEESAKYRRQFTLYIGTELQLPDPDLEAIPAAYGGGVGNVEAFRGLAYLVFPNKDITAWMSVPQFRFEVVTAGSATPPVQVTAIWNNQYLDSPDGDDWSGSWVPDLDLAGASTRRVIASATSLIAYGETNSRPAYRDGNTGNWVAATGDLTSGVGGGKRGVAGTDRIMIPGGLNVGILRSMDDGRSWQERFGPITQNAMLQFGASYYSWNQYDFEVVASPTFNSSYEYVQTLLTRGVHGYCCASDRNSIAMFGGAALVEGLYYASISWTVSGTSWVDRIFEDLPAQGFTEAAVGVIPGDVLSTLVAVTGDGAIVVRHPDGLFERSDHVFPASPTGMCHNGNKFFIIGGVAGVESTGYIESSVDGLTWVTERTWALGGVSAGGIGALDISAGTVTSGPVNLKDVVLRIHELCGQDLSKVDADALEARSLGGFILAGDYTGANAILSLASIYQFDSPEYDKQIHHRFRGAPVVRVITEADLVDEPEEGMREDQIEFPKKLHLEAQNTASGYAPAKETSERESSDVRVTGELSLSVPMVFSGNPEEQAQQHAQFANILHKVAWENARGEREIVVPDKFLTDVPGDCYTLSIRGRSDRMMITQQNYIDGVIRLRLRYDRASAFVSNRAGNTPQEQNPPPSTIPGETAFMVLDLPGLVDAEDQTTALRHIAMGPTREGWYGAEAQESNNGGSSFARISRVSGLGNGAIMGTLTVAVAAASPYYTDTTNRVQIQLDLASFSERVQGLTISEFLSEGGGFALRNDDGEVEILQYLDVEDLGDGLIELSTLQRGRLNTETFTFPIGSRFVLLSSVTVATLPSALIGQEVQHRAISYGETAETATFDTVTLQGNSQREWPVAHVLLDRVSDTINVTIVPRHRFGTELVPVRSINWDGFLVEFRDATDQIETVASLSPTLSFDASAMTFPIEVSVSQVNRITGPGPSVTEEIA